MKYIVWLLCLVLSNVAFSQMTEEASLYEFINGKVYKYSSNGEGKSLGLKINLKYPMSWKSQEGERPHIVRKFTQSDGYANAIIYIEKTDNVFTEEEISEQLCTESMKNAANTLGTYISSSNNLKIEGLRASYVEYTATNQRMERVIFSYNLNYQFFYKNYYVGFMCGVPDKIGETKESVKSRYNKIKSLFTMMFNSIVIYNVYD